MVNRELRRVQEKTSKSAQKKRAVAQKKKASEKKRGERKNFFAAVVQFLKDVRVETKKVIWPSKEEVANYTVVVLITVTVVTTFVLVLDLILSRLLALIIA